MKFWKREILFEDDEVNWEEYLFNNLPPLTKIIDSIRKQIDYQDIGRKILMVDPLPQGAIIR